MYYESKECYIPSRAFTYLPTFYKKIWPLKLAVILCREYIDSSWSTSNLWIYPNNDIIKNIFPREEKSWNCELRLIGQSRRHSRLLFQMTNRKQRLDSENLEGIAPRESWIFWSGSICVIMTLKGNRDLNCKVHGIVGTAPVDGIISKWRQEYIFLVIALLYHWEKMTSNKARISLIKHVR